MISLNYARLKRITLKDKPYRGSTNRYPIASRRESRKYFLAEQENGETIFRIIYGYEYEQKVVTFEEAKALEKEGKNVFLHSNTNDYTIWVSKPYEMGVVRSDNTFEFTAKQYSLGSRTFLSNMGVGYFFNDSRRGGMVFREGLRTGQQFYPIYRGMRVNIETMKPTKPITIMGKSVDRKASKKLMAEHQDFFKMAETLCKAMNIESWIDTAKDVYLEHNIETTPEPAILKLAEAMKSSAPIDAVILYALGMNIDGFRWKLKHPAAWHNHKEAIEIFDSMKTRLCKQIYRENEDTFKPVVYEMGKKYPPSDWGYTLMVDGVEVEQYGYGVRA